MKWISVKDRLPQPNQDVVATDGFECDVGFYSALGWCDFTFIPTHWYPIPEWVRLNEEECKT